MSKCPYCGAPVANELVCRICGKAIVNLSAPPAAPAQDAAQQSEISQIEAMLSEVHRPPSSPGAVKRPKTTPWALVGIVFSGIGLLGFGAWAMRTPGMPIDGAPVSAAPVTIARVANAGAPLTAAAPTLKVGAPEWVHTGRRTGYRSATDVFELAADDDIQVWHNRVRPVLSVRCVSHTIEVFVMTYSAASVENQTPQHSVRVSFDDGQAATQRWEHSIDHDALFAPDGATLARQIAAAHKMSFAFTPFNAPAAEVHFNVGGLDAQLASAAKTCGSR